MLEKTNLKGKLKESYGRRADVWDKMWKRKGEKKENREIKEEKWKKNEQIEWEKER